ncbi:HORMA domain-containing protein 2-like 1, partial [Homarus americanus]
SSYDDRNLDGLQLKMLLEKSASLSSNMVVSWLKGCFEAIEKQYLRQLTFIIYADPDNPELALETYTFKFQYTMEAGPIISELEANSEMCKKERKFAVKKSTEKMLRTILLLTQTLKPLPRKVHLAMKLGYYDN